MHEPKGADAANAGEVYISDGAGSGSWGSVGTSSFTGAVADFFGPIAPSGWLELDNSDISIITYAALYAHLTIQQTGTRSNGSNIITGLSSTTHMRVGYYAFGTGIAAGTTITQIDSASQIRLSGNASSSGSSTVVISPCYLDTGTIRLPNVTTAGRFRRSRTSSTVIGALQADQNQAHAHTYSGTTGNENTFHFHNVAGSTGTESADHTHGSIYTFTGGLQNYQAGGGQAVTNLGETAQTSSGVSNPHIHAFNVNSGNQSVLHQHGYSGTTASTGSTEARPLGIVVMTCIKT